MRRITQRIIAGRPAAPDPPGFAADGYWRDAARPLSSLVFVAPLILFYEIGVWWLGPLAVRNAADVWMRGLLDALGFGAYLLLPVLACGLLLAWHHLLALPWSLDARVLFGMLLESSLLGLVLLLFAGLHGRLLAHAVEAMPAAPSLAATMVAYTGAGIYEEVLFRLILLPLVWWLLRAAGVPPRASLIAAVAISALVFAAAHYQLPLTFAGWQLGTAHGEPFQWFSFFFRFLAGSFFGTLLLLRGFGITAGTHAVYDLYTLIL